MNEDVSKEKGAETAREEDSISEDRIEENASISEDSETLSEREDQRGADAEPEAENGDDVDIEVTADTGGGYNVGWIVNGEWLEYAVDVASDGFYDLSVRVAADPSTCTSIDFHIDIDGQNATGPQSSPPTTGGQDFKTVTVSNLQLDAGQQILRMAMDSDSWNLNWVEVTLVQEIVASDFNKDGDVDQEDFGFFQSCYSGLNPYPLGCDAADLNGTGNINLSDFDIFYSCMNGPNQSPGC